MSPDPNHPGPDPAARERELIAAAQHDLSQWAADTIPIRSPEDSGIAPPELAEDSFPGYRLIGEIHRGGQGVVYRALHLGTRREVAIKVLREGPFAGRQDIARFSREAQVLAQLKHPHIVTIHDSGVAAGRFYIVMDYIPGRSLDEYVAEVKPSLERTMRLFATICGAVHAAQLKGVIHRDLKPSNIRVDDAGEPHILDFGLAKLHGGDEADAIGPPTRAVSLTGQFIGSLPWASPEQAEGAPAKIDLRTDVYALGVILYQMLTGRFPYEVIGNMRDVLDNILRAEPARPSTVRRKINDEVETIVLKCLSKERERRYQSAGELAKDISHYLNGEPIEAKRDSAMYVMGKWARRNKLTTVVVTSVALLIAVTSVSLWLRNSALVEADEIKSRSLYLNAIALAQNDQKSNNLVRMRERLQNCPENLRGWEWAYLHGRADRRRLSVRPGGEEFYALAVSPDRTQIAVGGEGERVLILDAATGAARQALALPESTAPADEHHGRAAAGMTFVRTIRFHPSGKALAAGGSNGVVAAWSLPDGATVWKETGVSAGVNCIDFSGDGSRIAVARSEAPIEIRDAMNGAPRLNFSGHENEVLALAFSAEGAFVVSAGIGALFPQEGVVVWDADTGDVRLRLTGFFSAVESVAWSPDNALIAAGSFEGTIRLWNAADGKPVGDELVHGGGVTTLDFSPDSLRLASGGRDSVIRLWDVTGPNLLYGFPALEGRVERVAFLNRDGFAAVGEDSTLSVWDVAAGLDPLTLHGPGVGTSAVAFSPDGAWLAVSGLDSEVMVVEVSSGAQVAGLGGHEGHVRAVSFAPDGRRLVSGDDEGVLRVWDWATGQCEAEWEAHDRGIRDAVFSPDGRHLASSDMGGTVTVRDAATYSSNHRINIDGSIVVRTAFTSDGRYVAAATIKGTLALVDVSSGQVVTKFDPQAGHLTDLAVSKDGTRLGLMGAKELSVWSVADLTRSGQRSPSPLNRQARQPPSSARIAFSPDGRRLAVAAGNTLSLRDVETLQETMTLHAHDADGIAVAFSPDGQRIATGGMDRMVKLWEIAPPPGSLASRNESGLVRTKVANLYRRIGFRDEVIAALEADTTFSARARAAGRRLAEIREDDPACLIQLAWAAAAAADRTETEYRTAMRQAERAREILPESPRALALVGVLNYRLGRFDEARSILAELHADGAREGETQSLPADLAVLAMACHRLGLREEAESRLAELRALMLAPQQAADESARGFLAEAERVVSAVRTEDGRGGSK